MKKNITTLGRWQVYFNITRQYQGIVAFLVYAILIMGRFGLNPKWYWYVLLVPAIIFLSILVGFIAIKLGLKKAEMLEIEKNSPIRMEMYKMIKRIDKKRKNYEKFIVRTCSQRGSYKKSLRHQG